MEMQGDPLGNHNLNDSNTNTDSNENASNVSTPLVLFTSPTMSDGCSLFKGVHHRRAFSDSSCQASEDLSRTGNEAMFGSAAEMMDEMGSDDDLLSAFLDIQKIGVNWGGRCSMYQDDDQVDSGGGGGSGGDNGGGHGNMDQSFSFQPNKSSFAEEFAVCFEPKKALSHEKLEEMRAVDPKRVKRILANRQSAARSKERKARYIQELERKVNHLQSEATNLTAQLTIYQRDTMALTSENAELKLRLQALEQQAQLRDALGDTLKHEVERLKMATGETKTALDSFSLGGRRLSYTSLTSPSTLKQPLQYSPLPSPSTLQQPSYSLATVSSPSTLQHVPYNATETMTSPSSPSLQDVSYSSATPLTPSKLQPVSYSPAVSPSPRENSNIFPLPKASVPLLTQFPPLQHTRSSLSSRRILPRNLETMTDQNNPLQAIDKLN